MAKVIMPLLSGQVRGKVGDIVFFNRYGSQLARMRTIPANPNSMKQQIVRFNLKNLAIAWKGSQDTVTLKKVNKANNWATTEITIQKLTTQQKAAFNNKIYEFIKQAMNALMNNQNPQGVTIVT